MTPDALITAPFSLHRVCLQEGNRCGCHSGLWEESTGHVTDTCQSTPHGNLRSYYGGRKVQSTGRHAAALCQW
jgi:hypothetical protein